MPDSLLKQIADALLVEVQKVTEFNATRVGIAKGWQTEQNTPAAYVYLALDTKEGSPTASKSGTASFAVLVNIDSETAQTDFFDLYKKIETQIEDDPGLGGLVFTAEVKGARLTNTADVIRGNKYVADVLVDVEYRHARGAP
jgi:hypothetical protein